ncbi:hypothetical protein GCM10025759_14720 [Lysobacter panacisoli]|uniref:Uncharacterized protein n=1 Tax=Lysobacter panacisoli TaxID=1255263 RepID=A0ABP9LCL3_9GAMM
MPQIGHDTSFDRMDDKSQEELSKLIGSQGTEVADTLVRHVADRIEHGLSGDGLIDTPAGRTHHLGECEEHLNRRTPRKATQIETLEGCDRSVALHIANQSEQLSPGDAR